MVFGVLPEEETTSSSRAVFAAPNASVGCGHADARRRVVDLAVVLGVLAFSVLQLLLGGGFGDFAEVTAEPDGLAFALVLLSALALLWRTSTPARWCWPRWR